MLSRAESPLYNKLADYNRINMTLVLTYSCAYFDLENAGKTLYT